MSGKTLQPESGKGFKKRFRQIIAVLSAFAVLAGTVEAGTWNVVFSDDFNRPDSPSVGNTWKDTDKAGSIFNQTLKLTAPLGRTGSDLRVSRPATEYGLDQRIEASFVMPATNDGLSHSAYVRGKSLFVAGQRLDPAIMVHAQHHGNLAVVFGYRGGGRVYPYFTGGAFVSVPGHAYTLAVQITNNFPSVLSATLTDDTTSTVVASVSFNDAAQYTYPTTHRSPDFKTAGALGLAMEGPSGSSVSFTKVTTYRSKESGALTAPSGPAYTQHDGKTWLASPFPSGGTGSYKVRWYRGTFGFVPPLTQDGSGPGTGSYLGNTWELVDAHPPTGVTNWSIYYRAVYFDTGANAGTGILGQYRNTNSPPAQKSASPLWIGDSITFGYATSANWYTKSPAAYASAFLSSSSTLAANYSIYATGYNNVLGVSGRTSTEAVADLAKIVGQARITGTTFANIMLGTNDSKESVATPPALYKANISALVSALKEQNPDIKIVLNKPLWFKPDTGIYGSEFSTTSLGRIAQYHSMLDQMADGKSIVVGGMAAYDELQAHGWEGMIGQANPSNATTAYPPAPTGTQSYLADGLHPYDGGAEMVAKLEWGPNAMAALLGDYTPIPTVNAGASQVVTLPATSVTLAGSATNPNGPITDYVWTKVSGAPSTIESPTSTTTEVTGLTEGTHVFRLTATNSRGASGFGEVTVVVRLAASYTSWASLNGLTGPAAVPDADPDGNGTTNLVEYATGIQHGALPNVGQPTQQRTGETLSLTYRAVQTDVIYVPEWSEDLATWHATGITITTNGVYETATIPIAAGQQGFMRLRIFQN